MVLAWYVRTNAAGTGLRKPVEGRGSEKGNTGEGGTAILPPWRRASRAAQLDGLLSAAPENEFLLVLLALTRPQCPHFSDSGGTEVARYTDSVAW